MGFVCFVANRTSNKGAVLVGAFNPPQGERGLILMQIAAGAAIVIVLLILLDTIALLLILTSEIINYSQDTS